MKFTVFNILQLSFLLFIVPASIAGDIDTLAVTPFKVIGEFENVEILSHGLPDAIANDLSNIPGITVVERLHLSSVLNELKLSQSGIIKEQDALEVGQMLSAKLIITGSVQKLGKSIRIYLRGIETETGHVRFSIKNISEINSFSDIFKIGNTLVKKIVSRVRIELSKEEIDHINTTDLDSKIAFELYSKGLKSYDMGDFRTGLKLFQEAAETDKNFEWAQKVRIRAQRAFEELERELKK